MDQLRTFWFYPTESQHAPKANTVFSLRFRSSKLPLESTADMNESQINHAAIIKIRVFRALLLKKKERKKERKKKEKKKRKKLLRQM